MSYQIAPASTADAAQITELMTQTDTIDTHTVYTLWQSHYFDPDFFLVAKSDEHVLGYVFGRMAENNTAFLWQIAVEDTHRKKGIGCALVTAFLQQADTKGAKDVVTTIVPGNDASQRLMKRSAVKNGIPFVKTGDTGDFGNTMKTENIYCFQIGKKAQS
ncbi:MAG: GNAT family N-acetyltransferase [Pseudomonadota bacterium]|nr:GNAT family N-acetyltransferase [Pseudomonadota bacterium]QKK06363.1 MAG: GNAT family N-acetyltransferase [Pseudomonadota bacterium]